MNGLLRVLGWVVIAGGAILYLAVSVVTMNFLSSIPLLISAAILAVILFGLSEALELLWDQQERLERLGNKLNFLGREEPEQRGPAVCKKCGTQLPPGGTFCPTCHHHNV